MPTKINYVDEAWSPIRGCDMSLPCSLRCWARQDAHIHAGHKNPKMREHFEGLTNAKGEWTGIVRLDKAVLDWPRKWKAPRRIAVSFG